MHTQSSLSPPLSQRIRSGELYPAPSSALSLEDPAWRRCKVHAFFGDGRRSGRPHDVLRFNVTSVRRPRAAPSESIVFRGCALQETKFWDEKRRFGTEAIYGSAFNIRKDLDAQILSREVGRKGRTPTHQTKSNSVWGRGDLPPLGSADPLGVLGPQGKAPPSLSYI
ncbi:hypothetical protein ZWY2020_032894 [Hordeum vulgare]|nr:hypothetical protein ZWY2020_032894 [Hordeum vulgare]